jgi:RNA polymerase sigma-70 factor, ECF subfamily
MIDSGYKGFRMSQIDLLQIINDNFERIRRAALVLSGNPWDADDLAQETFMVFSAQFARFEGRSSIYTYLYGILLNLDRRERRRIGIHRRKLKVLWDCEPVEEKTTPASDRKVEIAEWKKSLWALVDQVPEGQRQALVLRFSEGLKYEEIADILQCPLGTVKSRIFHGLGAIRRMLQNDAEAQQRLAEFECEDLPHAV